MVQLFIYSEDKRKTILFIHGFGKKYDDWNVGVTHNNIVKDLRIEENLRKTHNTVLVQIEENDYKQSFESVIAQIYVEISKLLTTKLTIVAHSYGCLYAMSFAEIYNLGSLLLIEPVIKSLEFLAELKLRAINKDEDSVEHHKLVNFDILPTGSGIRNNIIMRIHVNSECEVRNLEKLDSLTNKNIKSRLIVHYKASHMIHYKLPHMILDSIKELSGM
ncbi:Hypothetical protein HVR_LOCUS643 [uncultured virus]|nr:Hypothetical protein HVR_LOCUS643 [uncultured virus]